MQQRGYVVVELWEALTNGSSRGGVHAWSGDGFEHSTWRQVLADAEPMAAALRAIGVGPGTRVATVLTNTPHTVRGVLAVWLAGGAVASLPLPNRGQSQQEYARLLSALTARLEPVAVLVDEQLVPLVPADLSGAVPVLGWAALAAAGPGRIEASPPGPDEVAFIQYSSGSTSEPKGCELTPRAITAQLRIIQTMSGARYGAETVACWLPLSHDMGMFGCLLYSWYHDFTLVLSTPERFGMAPRSWFRDMADFGATMTAGTSTALYLAARAQGRTTFSDPLQLRVCVIGAERVDAGMLGTAAATFAPHGLSPTAFMPAYGMAEATLAVTAATWDGVPTSRTFDREALLAGAVREVDAGHPRATRLVSNGCAQPGVEVSTERLDEVSEVLVSSPSLARGYHADPVRTRDRFKGGQLHTRDLGFVLDDELYLVGRADDMISLGGRKIHTGEVEAALDLLPGMRRSCSVLVDVPGPDGMARLVLLTEVRRVGDDVQRIADEALDVVRDVSGTALSQCVFLPRGTLPKTPSGKLQRFRCRELLTHGGPEPVAQVTFD